MAGMLKPKSSVTIVAVVSLLLLLVSVVYFAAYAAIGKRGTVTGPVKNGEAHFFRYHWQVALFAPAAKIESLIRGEEVYIGQWDVTK
jgi:hypothetical protein